MENQSLYQLMQIEDPMWLQTITQASDIAWLITEEKATKDQSRKAIINARIANLNHLIL